MLLFNTFISWSLFIKLWVIILFMLLSLYLLYQEGIIIDIENKYLNKWRHCGSRDSDINTQVLESSGTGGPSLRRTLRDMFLVVIPALMSYSSYIKNKNTDSEINSLKLDLQKANELKSNLNKELINNTELKTKLVSSVDRIVSYNKELVKSLTNKSKVLEEVKKIEKVKEKIHRKEALNDEEKSLVSEIKNIAIKKSDVDRYDQQAESYAKKIEYEGLEIDSISKSSIFSIDIDRILSSLSKEELLAFSGLLLNQLILSYVITIIFILYGDYLIVRFKLEIKYPKLAKFIQFRRKFQSYYLKVSFVWIFVGLFPQIIMSIYILSDRFMELFF